MGPNRNFVNSTEMSVIQRMKSQNIGISLVVIVTNEPVIVGDIRRTGREIGPVSQVA